MITPYSEALHARPLDLHTPEIAPNNSIAEIVALTDHLIDAAPDVLEASDADVWASTAPRDGVAIDGRVYGDLGAIADINNVGGRDAFRSNVGLRIRRIVDPETNRPVDQGVIAEIDVRFVPEGQGALPLTYAYSIARRPTKTDGRDGTYTIERRRDDKAPISAAIRLLRHYVAADTDGFERDTVQQNEIEALKSTLEGEVSLQRYRELSAFTLARAAVEERRTREEQPIGWSNNQQFRDALRTIPSEEWVTPMQQREAFFEAYPDALQEAIAYNETLVGSTEPIEVRNQAQAFIYLYGMMGKGKRISMLNGLARSVYGSFWDYDLKRGISFEPRVPGRDIIHLHPAVARREGAITTILQSGYRTEEVPGEAPALMSPAEVRRNYGGRPLGQPLRAVLRIDAESWFILGDSLAPHESGIPKQDRNLIRSKMIAVPLVQGKLDYTRIHRLMSAHDRPKDETPYEVAPGVELRLSGKDIRIVNTSGSNIALQRTYPTPYEPQTR